MFMRPAPPWLRLLCLLPFMVSALLPAGMMPAVSADGSFTLVICTADGAEERSFPVEGEQQNSASSLCPLSLLSAPALPSAPVYWTDSRLGEIVDFIVAARDVPTTRNVRTPRPRGPPSIL
ncbi:MAG: DUF2946 family protein [Pseudomonadota bacterium]